MAGAPGCSLLRVKFLWVSLWSFAAAARASGPPPPPPQCAQPPSSQQRQLSTPPPPPPPHRAAGSPTQQETEGGCGPKGMVGGRGLLGRRLRDALQTSSGGAFPVLPNPGLPCLPQPPAGMRCRPGPRPAPFRPWCCRPGPPTPGLWPSSPRGSCPLPPPCGPAVRTTWRPPGGGTAKRVGAQPGPRLLPSTVPTHALFWKGTENAETPPAREGLAWGCGQRWGVCALCSRWCPHKSAPARQRRQK